MKLCTTLLSLATIAVLGSCASTGSKNQPGYASDAAAMEASMPKPGPEHAWLQSLVGTWDATVTMMMPGQAPETSSATAVYRAVGPMWITSDFSGQMMGQPFTGHGVDGYDTLRKKFVSTWVDSMSTEILSMEGTHDAANGTSTMNCEGHDPMNGKVIKYRFVSEMKDNDSMTFHMKQLGEDGKYAEMMRIDYKRRK